MTPSDVNGEPLYFLDFCQDSMWIKVIMFKKGYKDISIFMIASRDLRCVNVRD